MKASITTLGVLLAASLAFGQATAPAPAKTAKHHAKTAAKSSAPAKKMASPMAPRPAHKAKAKPAAAPAAAAEAAAPATGMETASANTHKRDPFVNPIQAVREGKAGACSGGKRCLAVNEVVLRGIVKSVNGMIAVVENSAQRTYFLRENDPIYNGFVKSITPDSVVFREHYTDNLGHDAQRDVVKTVNAPVV